LTGKARKAKSIRNRLIVTLLSAVVIIAGGKAMKFQASDESGSMESASPAPAMMEMARRALQLFL